MVAIAAVNGFALDRSYSLRDRYAAEGLFDVDQLPTHDQSAIFDALRRAGYPRSDFVTGLVAERILTAAIQLAGERLDELEKMLAAANRDAVGKLLLPVRGVGPAVLSNFLALALSRGTAGRD